jgi:hypothetical protein
MVKAAAKIAKRTAKRAGKAKKARKKAVKREVRRENSKNAWAAESGADREYEFMREGFDDNGYEEAWRRDTGRTATKRGTSARGDKRRSAREKGYPKEKRVLTKKKIRQSSKAWKKSGGFLDPRGRG